MHLGSKSAFVFLCEGRTVGEGVGHCPVSLQMLPALSSSSMTPVSGGALVGVTRRSLAASGKGAEKLTLA